MKTGLKDKLKQKQGLRPSVVRGPNIRTWETSELEGQSERGAVEGKQEKRSQVTEEPSISEPERGLSWDQ